MSLPFLLEIGAEEIPDWMIRPALNALQNSFQTTLDATGLGGCVSRTDATPRRLVLFAEDIRERQSDTEELALGPPKRAPEAAVIGFAKKQGLGREDLAIHTTAKGEYWGAIKKTAGRPAREILIEALPALILKIPFPKTMYWNGKGSERFIRPIRWLVALLGTETLVFEIGGVYSSNRTRGHRLLGGESFEVNIADFEEKLNRNGVILSSDDRRNKIVVETEKLLFPAGLIAHADPGLLETLVYLTEFPTPIAGEFDPGYLELPREILTEVMRHHQKYFSVDDAQGNLAPRFLAVMNTNDDPEGLVKRGNERVLRARFNDARFFYQVDMKRTLASRVPDLAKVTFQAKLGSYLDKTNRMVALLETLPGAPPAALRAAYLSKADLTTEMVKEFTDLQGVIGGLYARAQGEPEDVARAIYEHYQPLSMEGALPATPGGQWLSYADKWDTLVSCFGVGLIPSGSKDPFALRRAAQGVVRLLAEARLPVTLACENAGLREFMRDRVEYYFRDVRGFAYDEVRACMAAGWTHVQDLEARLRRIQAIRPTADFEPVAASFKRIQNILRQAQFERGGGGVDRGALESGPERDLFDAIERTAGQPLEERIGPLRPRVDLFFDKVLVNAPDQAVRRNRLTLLSNLLAEFSTIADFSEIVTER